MLEWQGGADRRRSMCMPTVVKDSEPTRGEVLGVVAFLRARAQESDPAQSQLAEAAASVLKAAGRSVKAPVRGSLFTSPIAQDDAYDEYMRLEEAIGNMFFSPTVTDIRQVSEYIGSTPAWLASPWESPPPEAV